MMKKLSFLFFSLIVLGAMTGSCSTDDPTPTIQGKWVYDTYTYTNADGSTDEPTLAYDANCTDRKYFYFKPNGVFELGWVNLSTNPTNPCKFYKYDGTWKLENNTIITVLEGDTQESKVTLVSVSATNLVFKYPQPNDEYYLYTLKKSK
jgi:hypothetical protein